MTYEKVRRADPVHLRTKSLLYNRLLDERRVAYENGKITLNDYVQTNTPCERKKYASVLAQGSFICLARCGKATRRSVLSFLSAGEFW